MTDVRVLGAVGVVELKKIPPPQIVQNAVKQSGVWLRPFGNWLYTMPPFITSPEEISLIVSAMENLARQ